MNSLVDFEQLQRLCRPTGPRPTARTVRRWASQHGIAYAPDGSGGIWTTTAALNRVLGIQSNNDQIFLSASEDMM